MIQASRNTTKFPGTAISTGFGDAPWSNPSNVLTDNGSDVFWGAAGGGWESETLRVTNFGFNIPSTAVIEGVLVTVGDKFTFSQYTSEFRLRTNTLSGQDKGGFIAVQDTYGGSTDLWNLALTPAIVNGSDFGVDIQVGDISGGDAQVSFDYITITVYWRYDMTVAAAEVPTRNDYKIYNPTGLFLGNLPNVINEYNAQQDMNSAGSQLSIEVADDIDSSQPALALAALTQWLPGGWQYRQKLTIPRTALTGDLADFPVYVDLSHMDGRFWLNVDSAGDDVRVTDIYGISELPFELRNFNQSTKTGQLFFKATALSNDYDNEFYIYYGNPSAAAYAATATYGSQNVWSGYTAVYHLDEAANTTASGYKDATDDARHGTGVSMSQAAVAGKLAGSAADFDAVDDSISVGSNMGLGNANVTVSGWAYIDSTSEKGAFIKIGSGANGFAIGVGNATVEAVGSNIIMLFEAVRWIPTSYFVSAAGWYFVTMTIDGSGVPRLYMNGALNAAYTGTNAVAPTTSSTIGGYTNRYFGGKLDEWRVAATARNAEWIAAEYANQNSPSTFYSFGNEQNEDIEAYAALIKNGNLVNVYETSYYYPNGKLMYQGQINRVEAEFAGSPRSTIKILCHSDGRDLDNMVARGAPFTYTQDQAQTAQDNYFTVSGVWPGWERVGQLWTVGGGVTNLGRIQLLLLGNADVTVSVFTDVTQATFLGSVTKNVNVGGATVVSFEFGDFIDTTAAADYFMTVAVGTGQTMRVYYKASTNPYANGSMYTSSYAGGSGGGSYGISTNNDLYFTTAYGTPSTQATYTSDDPSSEMLPAIITDYNARGGNIRLLTGNYDATGLSLTASFNTNTIYEAIQKIMDMAPTGFYWYVDLGSNLLYFKRTSTTPDFLLYKGRHVESLSLAFSIENVINDMLFSGGATAGVNLYRQYIDATSKALYGTRLDRKSDNRVTVIATADAIGNSNIAEHKGEQYQTGIQVLARTMDITLLKPGKTIGFRGYGSFIDSMVLQITKVDYTARRAKLQVGTLPLRFNSAVEQTIRGLIAEQTVANPSTPG